MAANKLVFTFGNLLSGKNINNCVGALAVFCGCTVCHGTPGTVCSYRLKIKKDQVCVIGIPPLSYVPYKSCRKVKYPYIYTWPRSLRSKASV